VTRILIVDDEPENLHALRALLEGCGHAVDEARHGAEALVKARQVPPSLVISDLLMPAMDGYTLLRRWKADERLRNIPFVVYAASGTDPQDESLGVEMGADAFIVKPAEPGPFMARIRAVLAEAPRIGLTPARAEPVPNESEARLRGVMHSDTIGMLFWNAAGDVTEANDAFLRTVGFTRDDMRAGLVRWRAITPPEHLEKDEKALREMAAAGFCNPFEKEYLRKDGSRVPVLVGEAALPHQPDQGVAFVLDISERKRIEAALSESEERLRLFVRHAPAAIAMFDTQMRYLAVSDRWRLDYRIGHTELVGRSHYEVFPDIKERWKRVHARVLAGATERAEEDPFPRADGSVDWVRWEMLPWRTSDGAVGGALLLSEVVTERVELLERERRSRTIAETLAEANLALTRATDLETVLEALLDHLARLVPYDSANVMLLQEGRQLAVRATRGYQGLIAARAARSVVFEVGSNPLFEAIVTARAPLVVRDSLEEPAWQSAGGAEHVRSWLGVPLVQGGQVLGLFSVDKTEPGFFTPEHARLAAALAPAAATAIANARLLAELRESEAKYRVLIEESLAGVAIIQAGRFKYVNPTLAGIMGYSKEEMLAPGSVLELVAEEDRPLVLENLRRVEGETERVRLVFRARKKDGALAYVEVLGSRTTFEGRPAVMSTVLDVTERRRTEEALQASEARYRGLMEQAVDGIALADAQGRIQLVNSAFCALLGYTRDELLKLNLADTSPPAERAAFAQRASTVEKEGSIRFERTMMRKDGSTFPVDVVVGLTAGGLMQGIVRDITERRKRDESLREAEERIRTLVEHLQVGVLLQGPEAEILLSNPKALELLGLSKEQLLGKSSLDPDWDVVHEDGSAFPGPNHPVPQVIATNRPVRGVVMGVYRPATRDRVWLLVDAEPQLAADGALLRVICTFTDITRLRLAESGLRNLPRLLLAAQEEERRRVARELHDEIGQVLTAVKLNLQSLQRLPGASLGGQLAECVSSVDRGLSDVRNLAFALRPSILDDLGLAAALRWFVDREARAASIEGRLVIEPELPRLPSELEVGCFRVVQEAVTNVLRHSGARSFSVDVRRHDDHLQVSVGDDGKGFDTQAAQDPTRQGEAMGLLGMKERVSLLGGRLAIASTPGSGSEVRALFPLAAAAAAPGPLP
jgi:PAS domain S-box-containing protein